MFGVHHENVPLLQASQCVGVPDIYVVIFRNPYVGTKSPSAARATRLPSGHPEAFIEAFANIYCNFADTLRAHLVGAIPDPLFLDFPTAGDGLRGMTFLETVLASTKSDQKWMPIIE